MIFRNVAREVYNRIYSDYLMRSRLDEYRKVIECGIKLGFQHMTISEFHQQLSDGAIPKKVMLHRHDIDTDVSTAKQIHQIEQEFGVPSTFYFRLSTLDADLIREIAKSKSEVGYHYEELSQLCKDIGIKSQEGALACLPTMTERFEENLGRIRSQLQIGITSVAAHGDFVNRKIKLSNNLVVNEEVKRRLSIVCEAYDKRIMDAVDIYMRDKPYPKYYSPISIFDAMDCYNVIYFTTHPRQWKTNFWVNTFDNLKRLYEGAKWRTV